MKTWTIKRVGPGPESDATVKALKRDGFEVYTTTPSGITLLRRDGNYKPPKKTSKKKTKTE